MHDLFGFNPASLSDDELLERLSELTRRIVYASKFMNPEIAYLLQQQKAACEFEQRERIILPRLKARAAMPDVIIETDPDLAAAYRAELEAESNRRSPKAPRQQPFANMTRERIKPTATPTGEK